jgi:hypothetical protein
MRGIAHAGNRRGNMPFAIIAVTILAISLAYTVAAAQTEKVGDNAEDIDEEIDSIGKAVQDAETFVNRGMGEIIASIGKDADAGTLSSRAEKFVSAAIKWMDLQFPSTDGCVRVTVLDFSVTMTAENMNLEGDGFKPTYLKAAGHFSARFESDSGSAERTVAISSDGSCALPLLAEQGSLFEICLEGEGSVLSQMMTYQLTALAQQRVIAGYGSAATFGSMSTDRIITAEDVDESYRSCVSAIGMINFRSPFDGTEGRTGNLDLADCLVAEDGIVRIDLGAIYAQALISVLDDIVLQWADYFCGNLVVDFLDGASDRIKNAWDSVVNFLTGKDTMSASPYIKEIMESRGYSENEYRFLLNGMTADFYIPEFTVTKEIEGERRTFSVGGYNAHVRYPDVDILKWEGLSNFKSEYRLQNNEVREWIRGILNTAAINIGADRSVGQIAISVDRGDLEPFSESLRKAINGSLSKLDSDVERVVNSSIRSQTIYDPFYAAICGKLTKNFESAFGVDVLKKRIADAVDFESVEKMLDTDQLTEEERRYLMDSLRSASVEGKVVTDYEGAARDMLKRFDALMNVPDGQCGLMKKFLTMICEKAMPMLAAVNDIPERMINLCDEMCRNMYMNPYCGVINVPEENYFVLEGEAGRFREKISADYLLSPDIRIYSPNENLSDCVHYVGFNENRGASYCTVFRASVHDTICYTAEGSGPISLLMGVKDSSFSGTVPVDLEVKIVVFSGWGLSGVSSYKASNTVFSDGWVLLTKALEPLLEPLLKIFSMVREVIAVINSALLEVSKYVSKVIERLYDSVMGPIIELREFIDQHLDALLNTSIGSFANMIELIFNATIKKQTVGMSFMGLTLTFSTDVVSFVKSVRNLLTISLSGEISGLEIDCGMTIKEKDSAGGGREYFITGDAEVSGEDWGLDVGLDPLMKSSDHLVTVNGTVRGTSFDIVMPDLIQYREAGVRLSDIEGIGSVLSNIPLPALGLKGSLDAGLDLKYNIPFEAGVVVNEFESNPAGDDSGEEWVELYNSSNRSADISGFMICAGSNEKTKVMVLGDYEMVPHERLLVILEKHVRLLNDKNDSLSGDCIILKDREGAEIDRTPVERDTQNSSYTWQRVADGAVDWTFARGTPLAGNCGGLVNGDMVKGQMLDIFKESAMRALEDMDGVLRGTEDLSKFIQRAIQDAITTTIDRIAGCLVEASVFISFEVSDVAGATATGIRIALSIDSETVGNAIKYLVGEIEALLFNMGNPYGIDGGTMLYDNIDLAVTAYTGMKAPKFLEGDGVMPDVKLGVYISSNISGLCATFGKDVGRWSVNAGILIEDCPSALLPRRMDADPELKSDLWLIRAIIGES